MKSRVMRWVLFAVLAILVAAGAWYLLREQPLQVETARINEAPMQVAISAEGRTRVRDRFVVSAPIEGRLGRLETREGRTLKRGAILGWITPAPLEIRSERQREAALRAAEAEVESADARVMQARLSVEQAERELNRISGLVESGIRPGQDLDSFRTAAASAKQELASATSIASAARYHVEEVRSSLLKADGQAVPVRSPVDGVVLKLLQESERVVSAGTPVVEIGNPTGIELVFEVLSGDAVRIKPGFDVRVRNWGEDQQSDAVITMIEPGAFTKVSALGVEEQRVNVIAEFRGAIPALGDGYRVEGDIVVWKTPEAIQVPVSALFREGTQWNVFVVDGDRAVSRQVTVGQRNSQAAEVLSGLTKDEAVILFPDDRLSSGKRITTR
jgi:HlyD family secretion protein